MRRRQIPPIDVDAWADLFRAEIIDVLAYEPTQPLLHYTVLYIVAARFGELAGEAAADQAVRARIGIPGADVQLVDDEVQAVWTCDKRDRGAIARTLAVLRTVGVFAVPLSVIARAWRDVDLTDVAVPRQESYLQYPAEGLRVHDGETYTIESSDGKHIVELLVTARPGHGVFIEFNWKEK